MYVCNSGGSFTTERNPRAPLPARVGSRRGSRRHCREQLVLHSRQAPHVRHHQHRSRIPGLPGTGDTDDHRTNLKRARRSAAERLLAHTTTNTSGSPKRVASERFYYFLFVSHLLFFLSFVVHNRVNQISIHLYAYATASAITKYDLKQCEGGRSIVAVWAINKVNKLQTNCASYTHRQALG